MLTAATTLLRPFCDEDLDVLTALRNDVALQATLLSLPRGSSAERVRAWAAQLVSDAQTLFFVVASRESDRALGFVQLARMDFVHGRGELGIALTGSARGKGHGGEAILLLEAHAASVFRIRKVTLQVLRANSRAIHLYERLGYEQAGTMRAHFYNLGAYHDVVLMEKLLPGGTAA
jgi:diamine N-acetyltransferase